MIGDGEADACMSSCRRQDSVQIRSKLPTVCCDLDFLRVWSESGRASFFFPSCFIDNRQIADCQFEMERIFWYLNE